MMMMNRKKMMKRRVATKMKRLGRKRKRMRRLGRKRKRKMRL